MPRPFKCRRVSGNPQAYYFKPRGVSVSDLREVILTVDEFEAVRLADHEGLYQENAAKKMNVSRQTFSNIVGSAHKKIADAIVNAKALRIEGGIVETVQRQFICTECRNKWSEPFGTGRPDQCPKCRSRNIRRVPSGRGRTDAGGFGTDRGRCRRP